MQRLYELLINSLAAFYERPAMLSVVENPDELETHALWRRAVGSFCGNGSAASVSRAHQFNDRRVGSALNGALRGDCLRKQTGVTRINPGDAVF